jgi:type I restriction enzyme S subunit
MNNIKKQIPDGWTEATIGDVALLSKERATPPFDNSTKYIGLENIESHTAKILNYENADIVKSDKMKFGSGDILYGKLRPYLNKVCIPNFSGICSTDILVFKSLPCFDNRYLMNYLRTSKVIAFTSSNMAGIQLPRISSKKLFECTIPVAPLAEQTRIAEKVENLLASINKVKERLNTLPTHLKHFRQSILTDAVNGKLTKKWRKDKIIGQWKSTHLKEIISKIQYGYTASANLKINGPKFLRITDIQEGKVDWHNVPSCEIEKEQVNKYKLEKGDIVFARTGATTGKSFLIDKCPLAIFASYLIRVKPNHNKVLPEYLYLFFQSEAYWNQIADNLSGSAQPNCNATKLSNLQLRLPPLEEQKRIIYHIETLSQFADKIEKRISQAKEQANEFTQNLLGKAFSGELVPTEAELAKKEGRSYETAEELLVRIKLECKKLNAPKQKRHIMKKIKHKTQDMTADKLAEILFQTQNHKLSTNELFDKAGFDENSVDQFYELLRECVLQKRIIEIRKDNLALLEGVK